MKNLVLSFIAMLLVITSVSGAAQEEMETRSFWLLLANKTNRKITLYANNALEPLTDLVPNESDCIVIDLPCPRGACLLDKFLLQARFIGPEGREIEQGMQPLALPELQSSGIMMLVLAHEKMDDAVLSQKKNQKSTSLILMHVQLYLVELRQLL